MTNQIDPGRIVETRAVNHTRHVHPELNELVEHYLTRHLAGDWGDLDPDDRSANDWAATHSQRILSAYRLPAGLAATTGHPTIWVITEADRSATTICWPSDY